MDQLRITFEFDVVDGCVYVSSPDVPGLHIAGGSLAGALHVAGSATARLIRDNNMEHLKPLLRNG